MKAAIGEHKKFKFDSVFNWKPMEILKGGRYVIMLFTECQYPGRCILHSLKSVYLIIRKPI